MAKGRGIDPVKGRWGTCGQFKYYDPCNVKEDADKALETWDDVCTQLGIPHVLLSGTCLGFYRDGGYIENDSDIDVGIICSEVERKVVVTGLQAAGFVVGGVVPDRLVAECFKHEVMIGLHRIPGGPPPWTVTYAEGDPRETTFTFEKFDTINYNGREYNVPHPVEAYFTHLYGNQWGTRCLRPTWKAVVFVTGVFDLLHVGHVRFLQRAKAQGDVLVVCVATDALREQSPDKDTPTIPFEQRFEMIQALRCVDVVIPYEGPGTYEAVEEYGASIRVVSDQFPYDWPGYPEDLEELRRMEVKYVVVPHTPDISSDQIREQIKGE